MKSIVRIATLLGVVGTLGFATTWNGPLVDARCYASLLNNTGPDVGFVARDFAGMIRYCAPRAKTTSFAIVQPGGIPLRLDPRGNLQAAELVQNAGKKRILLVSVVAQRVHKTLQVTKLSWVRTIKAS
jgi:hypothetical protein